MQKLSERTVKLNTPTGASQARSNCGSVFKQYSSGGYSEQNSKTSDNNSDETLTPTTQGGQNLRVSVRYVLGWGTMGQ